MRRALIDAFRFNDKRLFLVTIHRHQKEMSQSDLDIVKSVCVNQKRFDWLKAFD